MDEVVLSVTDFVTILNQTLEFAYPNVTIEGELANVRVSRGKWVYFDIKDEFASVKCFGTVYQLPGPIEDGMHIRLVASPRLHMIYGFSLHILRMMPVGEGSIKKAADLLYKKLEKEGLFDVHRKRPLPAIPERIALITSIESAAYKDFVKVLEARWKNTHISVLDVQVQGEQAVSDITKAIERASQMDPLPEVVVITRGGGDADDLATYNTEQVVRAVAACRVPTLVAIGHEVDVSLAELAADKRASTPSNAAEILVPDTKAVKVELDRSRSILKQQIEIIVSHSEQILVSESLEIKTLVTNILQRNESTITQMNEVLLLLNPSAILKRGYSIVSSSKGDLIKSVRQVQKGEKLSVQLSDGTFDSIVD